MLRADNISGVWAGSVHISQVRTEAGGNLTILPAPEELVSAAYLCKPESKTQSAYAASSPTQILASSPAHIPGPMSVFRFMLSCKQDLVQFGRGWNIFIVEQEDDPGHRIPSEKLSAKSEWETGQMWERWEQRPGRTVSKVGWPAPGKWPDHHIPGWPCVTPPRCWWRLSVFSDEEWVTLEEATPPGTRTRQKGDPWLLEVSLPSFPSVSLLVLGMKLFHTIAANIHISRKAKAIYLGDKLKPLNTLHRKLWPRLKFKKWNGQWQFAKSGILRFQSAGWVGPNNWNQTPASWSHHPLPIFYRGGP